MKPIIILRKWQRTGIKLKGEEIEHVNSSVQVPYIVTSKQLNAPLDSLF